MAKQDKMIEYKKMESAKKVEEAKKCIDMMVKKGVPVTAYSVRYYTGLSKTFIYGNAEIAAYIEQHKSDKRFSKRLYGSKETLVLKDAFGCELSVGDDVVFYEPYHLCKLSKGKIVQLFKERVSIETKESEIKFRVQPKMVMKV